MQTADPVAVERAKARRKRNVLVALSAAVLIPLGAMVAVNHVDTPVPTPVWTEEALPVPDEDENGWSLIGHYHSTTISGIKLDALDKLLAVSKDGTPLPELGRLFAPARVVASKITEHTALCSEAFERERMVIPCLSLDRDACSAEPLQICGRLVMFAALDEAARGSARAAPRIAQVLRQLNDAATSSPHPWMQTRSLLVLREAIHHAFTIMRWRPTDRERIQSAIAAIDLPEERLVIGNYLLERMALRDALARADTWLVDEGATMLAFDEPYEQAKRGEPLPPPKDYTTGAFWWFDNPVGERMLDALQPGADEDFLEIKELRASVLERRAEALKRD